MSIVTGYCRRLCALSTSELFLLLSLRLAVRAVRDARRPDPAYLEGFQRARMTPTHAERLMAAMHIAHVAARRSVLIHDLKCAALSPDEELLLRTTRLLQDEDEFSARRLTWQLFPPATARIVLHHLDALALGMTRAGLSLPAPRGPGPRCPAEALVTRRLIEAEAADKGFPAVSETLWMN